MVSVRSSHMVPRSSERGRFATHRTTIRATNQGCYCSTAARGKVIVAIVLVLVVATTHLGCAAGLARLAIRAGPRVGTISAANGLANVSLRSSIAAAESTVAGALRTSVLVGGRSVVGSAALSVAELTEVACIRGASATLVGSRPMTALSRTHVVGSNGSILGSVEATGMDAIAIRNSRSGVTVHAVRDGRVITYHSRGDLIGFSEVQNGRVHHYISDNAGHYFIGYDLVRGGRVFQHDYSGTLVMETTFEGFAANTGFATASAAAALLLAAAEEFLEDSRKQALDETIRAHASHVIGVIDHYLATDGAHATHVIDAIDRYLAAEES